MELSPQMAGIFLVLAIALALVAIGVSGVALVGQRRVRAAYRKFSMSSDADVLALLERHIDGVTALRGEVGDLRGRSDDLRELIRGATSRVATVHYDAFDDMGGRLSFSTAILDERGDGLVMSSINGRTETRTYAKRITGGRSPHDVSSEEQEAIDRALSLEGRTGTLSSVGRSPKPSVVGRAGRVRDAS